MNGAKKVSPLRRVSGPLEDMLEVLLQSRVFRDWFAFAQTSSMLNVFVEPRGRVQLRDKRLQDSVVICACLRPVFLKVKKLLWFLQDFRS